MKVVEGIAEIDDLQRFLDRLDEIGDAHGCTVQAFDARYVVGADHLRRAVELADRAIVRGEAVARERGVEILLYAAGRRQIDRALAMGIEEGEHPLVVLVDEPSPAVRAALESSFDSESGDSDPESAAVAEVEALVTPAATLGEYDRERVREFFDVGDAELAGVEGDLTDLVLERVALLEVEK